MGNFIADFKKLPFLTAKLKLFSNKKNRFRAEIICLEMLKKRKDGNEWTIDSCGTSGFKKKKKKKNNQKIKLKILKQVIILENYLTKELS